MPVVSFLTVPGPLIQSLDVRKIQYKSDSRKRHTNTFNVTFTLSIRNLRQNRIWVLTLWLKHSLSQKCLIIRTVARSFPTPTIHSSAMKRNTLTHAQKHVIHQEITKRRKSDHNLILEEVSKWAKTERRLSFLPSNPVLSRLSRSGNLQPGNNAQMMRQHSPAQPELEKQLAAWVNDLNMQGHCVSGDMIREKGKQLLLDICTDLGGNGPRLKFTAGWLWNFQRRWNLKARKLHGEASDADDEAIAQALPDLRNLCPEYRPEDFWNADETGCNYSMAPDRNISTFSRSGHKKQKKRVALLVCCNSTGSDNFPLFIIGSARRPRCFQKRTAEQLGFDYGHNKKAWMTMALFFEWLKRFDTYICKTSGRTALLLLDNFLVMGLKQNYPILHRFE